jgi:hypothetical protein
MKERKKEGKERTDLKFLKVGRTRKIRNWLLTALSSIVPDGQENLAVQLG